MNSQINALLGQAIHYFENANLDAAEQILLKVLQMHGKNFDALHILGAIKGIKNEQQEAIRFFRKAVAINANHNFLQFNLAKALTEVGKNEESIPHHKKAVQLAPEHIEAWLNYGVSLSNCGRFEDALYCYEKIFALNPHFLQAWNNYGVACYKLARYEDALAAYDKALAIAPDHAESWSNRGAALDKLKRFPTAVEAYKKSLSINPSLADTWFNYGHSLKNLDHADEALAAYNQSFMIDPTNAEVWLESGFIFSEKKWYPAAFSAIEKAIEIAPDDVKFWNAKGALQITMLQFEEAHMSLDKAISLSPALVDIWMNKGKLLTMEKRHTEAAQSYYQALQLNPEQDWAYGHWIQSKLGSCDWRGLNDAIKTMTSLIEQAKQSATPMTVLATSDDPIVEQRAAELFMNAVFPDKRDTFHWANQPSNARIKIGYYSADFHSHATTHLMAELFELHDRSRFEIIVFSFGPYSEDPMRKRVLSAADQFLDVRDKTDREIADLSRSIGIDIAVDLKGYTMDCRAGIFAYRAAPVQVNYLGYPGTLSAPYMDYIVADPILIPSEAVSHYAEKIIYMPHSYQINDRRRIISEEKFSRQELGLPEDSFVFACFNNNYKISPECFDIWMRLLHRVPGSVLWLYQENSAAAENLKLEAERRGVSKERLIFAKIMAPELHLARHRQADLFLDTFNYNAHTTTSDALWAGLPVLTRLGKTFSARVAASLLTAAEMPELITTNNEEYEALALKLATDRDILAGLKQKLIDSRLTCPLFDSGLFTHHLEIAYEAIHQKRLEGSPVEHIHLN